MKRRVVLSILICLSIICACQKQDPGADAQLAQRKAELDAREKALDEREKAIGEWEKAMAKSRTITSRLPSPEASVDPEDAKAERERRIQQLPPELQALIRDRSLLESRTAAKNTTPVDPEQAKAEREKRIQQLPPELQALIRDRGMLGAGTAGKNTAPGDGAAELQRRLEEARRKAMDGVASPDAGSSDTQPSSSSPSPTPE